MWYASRSRVLHPSRVRPTVHTTRRCQCSSIFVYGSLHSERVNKIKKILRIAKKAPKFTPKRTSHWEKILHFPPHPVKPHFYSCHSFRIHFYSLARTPTVAVVCEWVRCFFAIAFAKLKGLWCTSCRKTKSECERGTTVNSIFLLHKTSKLDKCLGLADATTKAGAQMSLLTFG